jgi:hypothetical protein
VHPFLQKMLDESAAAVALSHERCELSGRNEPHTAELLVRSRETITASQARLIRLKQRPD